ncbi:MAG: ankyrin repeat domain-containing protein [Saprospiraceae bacterium]
MIKDTFIHAIQEGNIETVQFGLSENPSLINTKTEQGLSIFLLAMYYRKNDIVNVLLENKNEFDFFEAAAAGQLDFVKKRLEDQPAILNQYAVDGFTALGLSCFLNQKEIASFLLEKGADPNIASNNDFKVTPLHSAAAISQIEIVNILLENGANANAKQSSGVTALHSAAHNGTIEIVKLLLQNGADKNVKTQDGKSVLDFAKEGGFTETVDLLTK